MPAAPVSVKDAMDKRLAASALHKRATGAMPNRDELQALGRVEKAHDAKLLLYHLAHVPANVYRDIISVEHRGTMLDFNRIYQLGTTGAFYDVGAIIRRFHELLAIAGPDLLRGDDPKRAAELEKVQEAARGMKLANDRHEGKLIDRADAEATQGKAYAWFNGMLSQMESGLCNACGGTPAVRLAVREFVDRVRREIAEKESVTK